MVDELDSAEAPRPASVPVPPARVITGPPEPGPPVLRAAPPSRGRTSGGPPRSEERPATEQDPPPRPRSPEKPARSRSPLMPCHRQPGADTAAEVRAAKPPPKRHRSVSRRGMVPFAHHEDRDRPVGMSNEVLEPVAEPERPIRRS